MPSAETSTENASDNMIFEQEATLVGRFFLCPNCILRRRGHKWSRLWSYRPLKGSLKAVLLHRLSEKANPRIEEHFNLRLAVLWYQNIVQASIPSAMCYRMEQKFALYLLSERTIILCMRLRTDACSRCMGSPIIPCGQQ